MHAKGEKGEGRGGTIPMDSPRRKTRAWSDTVMGLVRKKKARVMWKSEREVRMVLADMSAMVGAGGSVAREKVEDGEGRGRRRKRWSCLLSRDYK